MTDTDDRSRQSAREDSVLVASEDVLRQQVGSLITDTVRDVCKYVNAVVGDTVIACPDHEIHTLLVGMLLAYKEKSHNAG